MIPFRNVGAVPVLHNTFVCGLTDSKLTVDCLYEVKLWTTLYSLLQVLIVSSVWRPPAACLTNPTKSSP
ncbi:hypothetical protein ANANG_G00123850 [Anguilla anguilla]|uniref:Uncharacterized protein n=1 Tax=Anguilla anguilla TaxID=7936 RepID=A0A9D3MDZ8_ANGAN|nr:hypothetical protein ANANG_G00123850 [Anguilla anguilla]